MVEVDTILLIIAIIGSSSGVAIPLRKEIQGLRECFTNMSQRVSYIEGQHSQKKCPIQ